MDEFIEVPCRRDFRATIADKQRSLDPLHQKKVDEIWYGEFQKRQGKLFNGYVFGIVDVNQEEILLEKIEYKMLLASLRDPLLAKVLDFMPLSTSGMTISEKKVLLGQRSLYVSTYPNGYEMVPSGSVDCKDTNQGVDLKGSLVQELYEEASIPPSYVEKTEGWTLIFDKAHKLYELVARIYVPPFFSTNPIHKGEGEYRSLMWLGKEELEKHLIQHSDHYVPLTKYLYREWRDFIP